MPTRIGWSSSARTSDVAAIVEIVFGATKVVPKTIKGNSGWSPPFDNCLGGDAAVEIPPAEQLFRYKVRIQKAAARNSSIQAVHLQ